MLIVDSLPDKELLGSDMENKTEKLNRVHVSQTCTLVLYTLWIQTQISIDKNEQKDYKN